MPCSSHHIRESTANQQQQSQQTQTAHARPVQRRTVSLDRSSVRQPAATLLVPPRFQQGQTSARGRRFADGVNDITDDELNHRFSLFGIQFSLRDLDVENLSSFYNAQRDDLRSFLRQNFFSNGEINDETVSSAIRDILAALDKYLGRLSSFSHQDYDVRKSIENLIMKSLPFIINLVTDDNSSEFGERIERQIVEFCENVYMILVKCIGVRDTETFLNEVANMVMTEGAANADNLRRFPRYIIQTFLIERRSYDLSEIQEFLVIKRPSAPTVRIWLTEARGSFINYLFTQAANCLAQRANRHGSRWGAANNYSDDGWGWNLRGWSVEQYSSRRFSKRTVADDWQSRALACAVLVELVANHNPRHWKTATTGENLIFTAELWRLIAIDPYRLLRVPSRTLTSAACRRSAERFCKARNRRTFSSS